MELNYATNGKANAGLTTGIIGTALGAMNSGLLGGIFNGGCGNCNASMYACSDNMAINRYEATQQARISELETEVKLRDANTYTDQKLLEVYRYFDNKFDGVNAAICAQNVYNATNSAAINCINGQIAQLMALTKVVIPSTSICPEPMARYNSWVAPTSTT